MIIMGIDPGTATTGFGFIECSKDQFKLLDYGCIKTLPNQSLSSRLQQINDDLKTLLKTWKPDSVAIEELFFSKNVKTAIHVAHARGAMMQLLSTSGYEIAEYKPQQVKAAVCDYGNAEKKQIQKMVQLIFQMDHLPTPDDAADALAIAFCHANTLKTNQILNSQEQLPAYNPSIISA